MSDLFKSYKDGVRKRYGMKGSGSTGFFMVFGLEDSPFCKSRDNIFSTPVNEKIRKDCMTILHDYKRATSRAIHEACS